MQRRSLLKGAGIVTVAVVGGGVWRAWDQGVFSVGEGPAYKPWKDWRNAGNDVPLALVRAAIVLYEIAFYRGETADLRMQSSQQWRGWVGTKLGTATIATRASQAATSS